MHCITLPYGNAGWAAKKMILAERIAARPPSPLIYNDVLILVSSVRLKRAYSRLFLEFAEQRGSCALVQPDILTLHQFFEKLYTRVNSPRLIDENSRLILLEGLVKEQLVTNIRFNQSPDLLAPSLSAALANMIEQLAAAGVGPDDLAQTIKDAEFFDKPQVKLLLDVYSRSLNMLTQKGLIDPAGMRSALLEKFDPAWLASYREIFIDNIQDASAVETAFLRKVAAVGTCTFFVEVVSPDLLERVGDFHPLRITRDFLEAAGAAPEQHAAPADSDDLCLAKALFSDKSFTETAGQAPEKFAKDIRVLGAVNTREEVSLIAGRVKNSLRNGTAPDAILVAFPSLDEYGPLVEEIFIDYGIPYNRALGRQLSTSPVATSLIALLRACQEDFSGPSLMRVVSSSFLKFGGESAIAPALDRLMRKQRITGGRDKLRKALVQHRSAEQEHDVLSGLLKELFSALEPFITKDPAPLATWMARLSDLMAWSGLAERVALIKGPLNINLQAYKKLTDTLASLGRAGALFPDYSYTFSEWLFLLKRTFMHARFQVPPEDEGGVQILGLEESMGHPWAEIYLGGLIDGKFPQRLPQNIFLPEQTLEAMGVRTLERARLKAAHHFYRILLSAGKITLTFPENEGDRPMVPSPFLEELTPLRKAGLLNRGIVKTSKIQGSLTINESRSIPELAKALGVAGPTLDVTEIPGLNIAGMSGIQSALRYHSAEPASTIVPQQKRTFRVTELDDYLKCPYAYYVKHILGIGPLEEVTEDISPLDRGNKVHAILRNFYLSWNTAVTRSNRNEARALLQKLANSAFHQEADTFRNQREKELFLSTMGERFLDAEEAFWKQGMKPAYLEQKIESFALTLSDNTEVTLSAKIDRVDVDADGNFMIVDYKTGNYPQPVKGVEQNIFQLPIYAIMAQQALAGGNPKLIKPIGLAYYDLAGKNTGSARDVVLYNKDLGIDHPAIKPLASPKSRDEFEMILKQSMDKARRAIENILAGDFTAEPQDDNPCRTCPDSMMCGIKEITERE